MLICKKCTGNCLLCDAKDLAKCTDCSGGNVLIDGNCVDIITYYKTNPTGNLGLEKAK